MLQITPAGLELDLHYFYNKVHVYDCEKSYALSALISSNMVDLGNLRESILQKNQEIIKSIFFPFYWNCALKL